MSDGKDFWDKLGSYFTLIELTGNSDGVAKFDVAATSRGIPLKILEIEDPDLQEAYDVEAILVRPDDFIAWSGPRYKIIWAHQNGFNVVSLLKVRVFNL